MAWKDYLYFRRDQKIAVVILLGLILAALIIDGVLSSRKQRQVVIIQNDSLQREFEAFEKSLQEKEENIDSGYRRRYYASSDERTYPDRQSEYESKNRETGYTHFPKAEKLAEGQTISLNDADTAQWKKIPGIGSAFASRIVKYRNRLGGFASVDQLKEVYGIDAELYSKISPYIKPDGNYSKINVNKLEFKQLLSHPYLNYKQVKAIVSLRDRKGKIASINELSMLDEFTTADIERLAPYLEFE
ncbi:MAG: helix-hairpin-helix domain-containing protein [Dysgonomonadaceae bacterium]|nr:helix-hairpin-helix domain-containing protein [Dysgonamonadaceae bacterium]MBP9032132.1 helix-hairpin-helix domain-containing protein [Dysgonamonadaceae bacterium]